MRAMAMDGRNSKELHVFVDEHDDALGLDGFFSADGPDLFTRFRFHADLSDVQGQDLGDTATDGVFVRADPGALDVHHAVDVRDLPVRLGDEVARLAEHVGGITAVVVRVVIGEQFADVAQRRSAEQGVGHRVQQRVGVAVADRVVIVWDLHSAEQQRAAAGETMGIVTDSDAKGGRGEAPCGNS